jgi:hypothetical protein
VRAGLQGEPEFQQSEVLRAVMRGSQAGRCDYCRDV